MNDLLVGALERLTDQNDEIIRLLSDIKYELETVNREVSWIESHSFASRVIDSLDQIVMRLP